MTNTIIVTLAVQPFDQNEFWMGVFASFEIGLPVALAVLGVRAIIRLIMG